MIVTDRKPHGCGDRAYRGEADTGKGPADLCPAKPVRHGWRTVDLQAKLGLRSAASIHSVSVTIIPRLLALNCSGIWNNYLVIENGRQ